MTAAYIVLIIVAIASIYWWNQIHDRFTSPEDEKLATKIVQLRAEMMRKPPSERAEYLSLIKRLEAQYAFLTGDVPQINIPKPKLHSVDKAPQKVEVINLDDKRKLREINKQKKVNEED